MANVGLRDPSLASNLWTDKLSKLDDAKMSEDTEAPVSNDKSEESHNVTDASSTSTVIPIDPKDVTLLPPPEYRCPGRGRWTNQLKYLLMTVIKPILNLKCARYFKAPVDPIALRVPSYYDIITKPMDLGSIKKRLENNYYINAQECIDDVNLVLRNCYTFNKPDHFVYAEGRQLEEQFKKRIGKMPFDEIEIPFNSKAPNVSSPKKKQPSASTTQAVHSTSTTNDGLELPPTLLKNETAVDKLGTVVESSEADSPSSKMIADHPSPPPLEDARTPQIDCDNDEDEDPSLPPPLTPAPAAMEDSSVDSSQAVTQSGLPIVECAMSRPQLSPDDSVSSAVDDTAVVHSTQEDDDRLQCPVSSNTSKQLNISIDESKDDDYSASDASVPFDSSEHVETTTRLVTSSVRPFAVQPSKTKKGVKRKADTTTPHTPSFKANNLYLDDLSSARTSTRKIKPPNKELPGEDEPFGKAFKKSPLSNQMRFCNSLIKELLGKSHYEYAWPFHEPVDVEKWNLPDYHDKIKQPMDLGTVKKRMDCREYKNPTEFAADVRLIFSNCYQYNPSDNPVYIMAQRLHNVFESRFAKLPSKSPSSFGELSVSTHGSDRFHFCNNHTRSSSVHTPNYGKNYQTNLAAAKVSAKHASPNKYKKSSNHVDCRSNHEGRKNSKYQQKNHGNAYSRSSSVDHSPQQPKQAAHPTPVVSNPQPELPDVNTIAALQKQLQAVMHQLAQIQQGGVQFDAKARDASNIQHQINSLSTTSGAQKKPRAPKRPRKQKNAASGQNSAEANKSGSTGLASSSANSSNNVVNSASATSEISVANSICPASNPPKHNNEPGAINSTKTPHSQSLSRHPHSQQSAACSALSSQAVITSASAATNNSSMITSQETQRATSPPVSRTATDSALSDLGPGQLPLTNGLPSTPNGPTNSSAAAASSVQSSMPNGYWSSSVSKSNINSESHNSLSATSSATSVTNKANKKKSPTDSQQSSPVPSKKSNLKKVTKMPRPSDFVLDSDEEDNATDMTYEEKRQLSSNIDRLTKPQLYRVVHILRAHEPQLQDADVAEITLDLETVRAVTLRALEKFVNQCLKSKRPRTSGASAAKKQAKSAPPPPPPLPDETLPLEEYRSRKEELVRKIEELGGKKMTKSYEKELSEGFNLDPVNQGVSRLSDASSSDDSGDSSSDSDGGSSDSDDSSDEEGSSPPKGALKSGATAAAASAAGGKKRQSPKSSSALNGEKKRGVSSLHIQAQPSTVAAFSNFAEGIIKTTEATAAANAASSLTPSTPGLSSLGSVGANRKVSASCLAADLNSSTSAGTKSAAAAAAAGSVSVSANVSRVLSTWNSCVAAATASCSSSSSSSYSATPTTPSCSSSTTPTVSTCSSSCSPASSVNSMFQHFQKQARERTHFEQQMKNKTSVAASEEETLATNTLQSAFKSSHAPNLSESEDEEMVSSKGSSSKFGHVVDLNEQMNLINSFESSTTSS